MSRSVHRGARSSNLPLRPDLHPHAAHFEHGSGEALEEDGFVVGILGDIAAGFDIDEQGGIGGEDALVLQHRRVVVLVEEVGRDGLRGDARCAVQGLRAHCAELVGVAGGEERVEPRCAVEAEEASGYLGAVHSAECVRA